MLTLRPLACVIVLAAVLSQFGVGAAAAAPKTYGFDDPDAGTGAELTAAEKQKIRDALAKLRGMTITTKDSSYSGTAIEKDLEAMVKDGRMGRGVGANADNCGMTLCDGESSTKGDRMNIADHHLASASNEELANTLAHEWLHATQGRNGTEAEDEAPAYQLGRQVYLDKGGGTGDAPAEYDALRILGYKIELLLAEIKLLASKASAFGTMRKRARCGGEYYMFQSPGRLYFWSGAWLDSVLALPNQQYFNLVTYPIAPDCDRILLFGSDLTVPESPVGTLTVVDAGESGFLSRTDLLLPGLMYPFSVSRDPASGKLYVLDAHFDGPGIVSLEDTNADLIPDLMQAFAPRGTTPVDSAEAVVWATVPGLGSGLAVDEHDDRGDDHVVRTEFLTFLRDTDSDGLADASSTLRESDLTRYAPTFADVLRPGDTSVRVMAMPGHVVQVVLTDEAGDADLGAIGIAVALPSALPRTIPVTPLEAGQFVKAVDLTDNTQAAAGTPVVAAVPLASPMSLAGLTTLLAIGGGFAMSRRRTRPRDPRA